ncbi:DUF4183 domain-containing protein [Amphibacillus sediminis]|uniref:DUF4183 domain-containing protein n=1 Tax=Amphibacillus sediminis TaxID=360185 RepID=UPI00082AF02D|nr:DUF4183 domain-containing protein [Amphibacillus sediminis]
MALQLMKLALDATVTTTLNPSTTKYFYVTTEVTPAGETLTIDPTDFFDDAGVSVSELPELATDNSYYRVYINGVLQMQGITTYTPGETAVGSLTVSVPEGNESILLNTPIVLEVITYTPNTEAEINS